MPPNSPPTPTLPQAILRAFSAEMIGQQNLLDLVVAAERLESRVEELEAARRAAARRARAVEAGKP